MFVETLEYHSAGRGLWPSPGALPAAVTPEASWVLQLISDFTACIGLGVGFCSLHTSFPNPPSSVGFVLKSGAV